MEARPGWKRIARAGLVFLVALVVFDRAWHVALDWTYRAVDRTPEVGWRLEGVTNKSAYQWLILGSSRTFDAVHPAFIARDLGVTAFKEAAKGKSFRYNYEFYRLYTGIVGKPRIVIYGLDYFMFSTPSDPRLLRRFATAPESAARPLAAWPPLLLLANKAADEQAVVRILERLQTRLVLAMGGNDPADPIDATGAFTGSRVSRIVERPAPAKVSTIPYARYPGHEGEYFSRLLRAWQDDGVGVVFVYPPDYIATHRTNVEHEAFIAEIRRLTAGCRLCAVVDYGDPARFPLSTAAYFIDGDYGNPNSHLSTRGSEVFNRVFLPDVKRIVAGFDDLRRQPR
jgi:hypothetical protein